MTMFILLTGGQADQVRGPSSVTPAAALNPTERQGAVFILSVAVLSDTAHAAHWTFLVNLPQRDSGEPDFPPAPESPEE